MNNYYTGRCRALRNLCAGALFCSDDSTADDFLISNQFSVGKGGGCLSFWSLEAVFRPPQTLCPLRGQPVAVLVQVHQREGRAQPLVVFPYASVAHLGKSEDALQNAKRMFHSGSNSSLGGVLAPRFFIHIVLVFRPAASHILRFRCGSADRFALALICAIAPYLALFAVQ